MIKGLILTNGTHVIKKGAQFFEESETKKSIALFEKDKNGEVIFIKRFQSRHILYVEKE